MAYGLKYNIPFTNRQQDDCEVRISAKDYVGDSTELEGSSRPFVLSSQAQDNTIPYGICSTEAVIEFYTSGLVTLTDLYSEDDTFWLVEFYYRGSLSWTGYLQLDNSSERITDQNHIISLNANDGTGRLEDLYFIDDNGLPLIRNWTLAETLSEIFAFLPILQIKAWLNIYENSTFDRDYLNYETFLPQTAFNTRYFLNDDGTTQTLYEILNDILIAFRSCLRQAGGYWQIIRWGDVRIFGDGEMPGTLYTGFIGSYEEIFFPASIDIGRNLPIFPINENQLQRILRPYQFVKETFNYTQPPYITQSDLQIQKDAAPFNSTTIGDFRYDDYSLATYFTAWTQRNGDTSYLQIKTDITSAVENEVERYIFQPGQSVNNCGIQFNPIPVTAGDTINFSLQFRADDSDPTFRIYVRFLLLLPNGNVRALTPSGLWSIAFICADIDTGDYLVVIGLDNNDYQQWDLSTFPQFPIPEDGELLIQMNSSSINNGEEHPDIKWNDLTISFNNAVNTQQIITGQFSENSQDAEIRNNLQYEVVLDDSPNNTITGTLFTNALSAFCSIGDVYFTKTAAWHRQGIAEARRLGDLNTFNDFFIQYHTRTIVEGDFYGLRDIDLLSLINLSWLSDKKFIFGTAQFDYMSCIWNATLYELFEVGESEYVTIVTTLLDTNADETTYASTGTSQAISFSDIITNTDFTPDGGFINWTYDGVSGTRTINVNINGIWDSTASATLNLKVNGIVIGSFFVGIGGAFHFFTANIQQTITLNTSDVILVTLDWSGSTAYSLEIQAASYLRVTEDDIVRVGSYEFNYIYNNG